MKMKKKLLSMLVMLMLLIVPMSVGVSAADEEHGEHNQKAPPTCYMHSWKYSANENVITAACSKCKRTASITLTAEGKVYDGKAVTASAVKSSNWDNEMGLAKPGNIYYSKNYSKNVGSYTAEISVGGAKATKAFEITKKTVTVSLPTASKPYDGTTAAPVNAQAATISGKVSGDKLYFSAKGGSFADANVGDNKPITLAEPALTGDSKGNYALGTVSCIGSITPRKVTVSGIAALEKVYDGTTVAELDFSKAVISGALPGDNVQVKAVGDAKGTFDSKNVGNKKTVTLPPLELTGQGASNYVLSASGSQKTATASIKPKQLTLEWSDLELAYNAKAQKPKATVAGAVAGDKLFVEVETPYPCIRVGEYKAFAGVSGTGGNYIKPENTIATFKINPCEVKLTWQNTSFTYDGFPHMPNATVSGVYKGDYFGAYVEGAHRSAGNYTAVAKVMKGSSGNYKLPDNPSTPYTILPKEVRIGWEVPMFEYNGQVQLPTVLVHPEDLVWPDSCAVTVTLAQGDGRSAGTHTAQIPEGSAALSNKNYCVKTGSTKEYYIAPKPITITADNKESVSPRIEELTWTMEAEGDNWLEEERADIGFSVKDALGNPVDLTEAPTGEYIITPLWKTENKNYRATFKAGTYFLHTPVKSDKVDPTCTEPGADEYWTCSHADGEDHYFGDAECTEEIEKYSWIKGATGHRFGEWTVKDEATEDAKGLKIRTCEICGHEETEEIDQIVAYRYQLLSMGWEKGSNKPLVLIVHRSVDDNLTFGLFDSFEVDGVAVDPTAYIATAGSLNLSVKPEYLETLADGTHTMKVNFKDGSASTELLISTPQADGDKDEDGNKGADDNKSKGEEKTVNPEKGADKKDEEVLAAEEDPVEIKEKDADSKALSADKIKTATAASKKAATKAATSAPKTGDDSKAATWMFLMLAALAGIALAEIRRRKTRG